MAVWTNPSNRFTRLALKYPTKSTVERTYGASNQDGDNWYNFLAFMGKLYVVGNAARLIYDTRGVQRGGNTSGDIVLCEAEHLEEFVDGAGGTVTDLAQLFDSERYQSLRACDSLKYGAIITKKRRRRCTGCLAAYYCSGKCQALDWDAGNRLVCQRIRRNRQVVFLKENPAARM
ncbi:hypothetical protein C8J57DRAFT_1245150 [Mycena rebaudengoi]|nr:hypothetical protein C8J57DRAFT_1245150 [Mycena rebaudengoi]